MSTTARWPDRAVFHALMQNPSEHFVDDSFRRATFATKSGKILAWNGARTIVFRAEIDDEGLTAVRFPLTEDRAASTRYQKLELHLQDHGLESFVPARWMSDGLAVGSETFPMMTMPWIDGVAINTHVSDVVSSSVSKIELGNLSDSWQICCRALVDRHLAHGDIHAGNVLVQQGADGTELRHIDYDSVWVPGLTEASVEIGIPGFQHPGRALRHWGRDMDAFPNAVMYVSLVALAADPSLWRYNASDDTMLFSADAIVDAPRGEIWDALRSSADGQVRALTEQLLQWIAKTPQTFETLDQFVTAAATVPPVQRGPNTWPPTKDPAAASGPLTWTTPPAAGQPAATPAATPAAARQHGAPRTPVQQWGARPATGVEPQLPPPPKVPAGDTSFASVLIVIFVVLAIVAFLSKL